MIFVRATVREFTAIGIAVFLVLLVITFTTQLIRLLGSAAGGGIPTDAVLVLLGFAALGYLSVLLSATLFLSVLLSLTRAYRDSEMVAHLFDERNGAVERMVEMAIEAAHRAGKKIGICGQAPSDYPEFARFLVERGITSISLNPDTVIKTTQIIADAEAQLNKRQVISTRNITRPTITATDTPS